jgi:hypothetical protein
MRIIIEFDASEAGNRNQPDVSITSQAQASPQKEAGREMPATDAGPAPGTHDETHSELPEKMEAGSQSPSDATSAGGAPDLLGA